MLTLVYDGMCHLCSGSVEWIARRATPGQIRYVTVQSEEGAKLLASAGINALDPQTFLVIDNGKYLMRSRAVISLLEMVGGGWKIAAWLLKILPASFADAVYGWVARNRYKWFGRRDSCFIQK